jgi:hypothetical protein
LLADERSRLNEFAVLAFCAEITRLPGHCAPRSVPENAIAHTTPSLLTTVAHIWKLRPLVSAATALSSAAFSAAWDGRLLQSLSLPAKADDGMRKIASNKLNVIVRFIRTSMRQLH